MKLSRRSTFHSRIASLLAITVLASASALGFAQGVSFPHSSGASPVSEGADIRDQGSNSSFSSSAAGFEGRAPFEALPIAPSPYLAASEKHNGSTPSYPAYHSRLDHLAIEAGAGLTSPVGKDTQFVTYGYNITVGAGWNFSRKFGALVEYQFNRNKIPGATLSKVGVPGGNVNTYSFTVDPIYNFARFGKFGGYGTGGGGFYRKVTNYTAPQQTTYCDPYYGCGPGYQNTTVGHFSSNQGGFNIGGGVTYAAFGDDSRARLYAELRYEWVDSPKATATMPGTGTETFLPLTLGFRF